MSHHNVTRRIAAWRRAAVACGAALLLFGQAAALAPRAALAQTAPAAAAAPASVVQENPELEIVYIDNNGVIRVIDTHQVGSSPPVTWFSPVSGWYELALGDVNNDGDMEIIAVGGNSSDTYRFAIYDPIVRQGNNDGTIGGIPWAKLYESALPFRPLMAAAGNFDNAVAGDELLISMAVPEGDGPEEDDLGRLDVYKATNATTPDGRNWTIHIGPKYYNDTWTRASVGDVIPGDEEEIAIVSEDTSNLEAHRFTGGFRRIGDPDGDYKDAAIGNVIDAGGMELAAVREQDPPGLSLLVWQWSVADNDWVDSFDRNDSFDPQPRRMALADVNGNGDDEIFMLRNFDGDGARLLSRNRGSDGAVNFEEPLDDDNGFRTLTGGDLDGDGRDEVILIRDDEMRIYREAATSTDTYDTRNVNTNRRTVVTGDLDAVGFITGAQFATNKSTVEATTVAGGQTSTTLELRNASTQEALPYAITAQDNPPWLLINPLVGSTPADGTPVSISMTFLATDLLPGTYRSRLFIDSSAEVINAPLEVVVSFVVTPAEFNAQPGTALFIPACSATGPITAVLDIAGTQNLVYTAAIVAKPQVDAALAQLRGGIAGATINAAGNLVLRDASGASAELELRRPFVKGMTPAVAAAEWPSGLPWAAASSVDGVLPDQLTMTVDPTLVGSGFAEGWLVLVADERAGIAPANVRLVPILYMCDATQVFLVPTVKP
jgi:hypothetical protein